MLHKVALISDYSIEQKRIAFSKFPLSEQDYIKSKPAKKAEQSICARILLSELIKEKMGKETSSLLERDKNKKPFVRGMSNLFVSISHSENLVAAAISSFPIGIDIEKIKPLKSDHINRILTPAEQELVEIRGGEAFYRIWTAKEALIKTGAYSYAQAKGLSFVENCEIVCPKEFSLEQYLFEGAAISIIEQKK